MCHDVPSIVLHIPKPAGDPFDLLDDAVEASVLALVTFSVRATRIAGHQVWIVRASRVISPMFASAQAS